MLKIGFSRKYVKKKTKKQSVFFIWLFGLFMFLFMFMFLGGSVLFWFFVFVFVFVFVFFSFLLTKLLAQTSLFAIKNKACKR